MGAGASFATPGLLLLHLDLLLIVRDRVVLVAHAVSRHGPELGLRQPGRIQRIAAHLQLLQRDNVLIFAEAEEAAATNDGKLLARAIDQHLVDAAEPLILGAINSAVDQL